MHNFSYFRLHYRFIDFVDFIHLPGFIKYELWNGWLLKFEGLPEPGDSGEFLILFINENKLVMREITLVVEKPLDMEEYNKFKKERVKIFL